MPFTSPERPPTRTSTDDILEYIHTVIKKTTWPSWMNTVPGGFGKAKTGTLKADEWRNLATVHLPIALTLLWGKGSKHKQSEDAPILLQHLNHTMSLVQAITLACYRTTTEYRIGQIRRHLLAYLDELHFLFPDVEPLTNQHMSLHLSGFLRLFGPVHSWWTFPFERLIGRLQHFPTNHKFGKSSYGSSSRDH